MREKEQIIETRQTTDITSQTITLEQLILLRSKVPICKTY
jgi:hypothetical protein